MRYPETIVATIGIVTYLTFLLVDYYLSRRSERSKSNRV